MALATERDAHHEPVVSTGGMSEFLDLTYGSKFKDLDVFSIAMVDGYRSSERVVHGDSGRSRKGGRGSGGGGGGDGASERTVTKSRGYGAVADESEQDELTSLLAGGGGGSGGGGGGGGDGGRDTAASGGNVRADGGAGGAGRAKASGRKSQIDLTVFKAVTHKLLTEKHSIPVPTFMQQVS